MRLVCLECSAAYEAPDNLFGPQPREVRCNRCGYQWTVVGPRPEDNLAPAEPPRPRPAFAPAARADPLGIAPPPAPVPPLQRVSRHAEGTASAVMPHENQAGDAMPRPALVVEPAAASTRTLLASGPAEKAHAAPPDPEERRLSHELDFGEASWPRRTNDKGGGTRRIVIILIMLVILAVLAAVIFETQIIAAFPALKSIYEQLGL